MNAFTMHRNRRRWLLPIVAAAAALLTTVPAAVQAHSPPPEKQTADNDLQVALSYYDDDTYIAQAATMFQAILKRYPGSSEAATAAYYVARCYHRRYYVLAAQGPASTDDHLLKDAIRAYDDYISKWARYNHNLWVADSRLEKSLIFLRLEKRGDAKKEWGKMKKTKSGRLVDGDPYVYIGGWLFSRQTTDYVNYPFSTPELAQALNDYLAQHDDEETDALIGDLGNLLKTLALQHRQTQPRQGK